MEQVYAVIGDPIKHSMSPQIHNDALNSYKICARYHAFEVKKEKLREAVEGMRALNIKGFNVTVPHKVDIIPLLDHIDESAQLVGAVNTVVNQNGTLIGYNTDGIGFYRSIQPYLTKHHDKTEVLIIGAGGASRAIFNTLAKEGFSHIDIVNRTKERAMKLKEICPFNVQGNVYSLEEIKNVTKQYDLVIQTTSIGMSPSVSEKPLELEGYISEQSVVTDIIYNPIETAFLKEANQIGAKTIDGVGMFVHQAAESFELWTGVKPDISRMKQIVYEKLRGASRC